MKIIDLECISPPVPRSGKPLEHYTYANGWEDYIGMGISVLCIYDYITDKLSSYTVDELSQKPMQKILTKYLNSGLVVGFNIRKYDNPMLKAHGIKINDEKCYDIYYQLLYALGLDPLVWDRKTHSGLSLNAILKANNLVIKSGSGADAPYLWQDDKKQEVINYCKNDVMVEKALLDKIFEQGYIINPKNNLSIKMSIPCM